MSKRVLRPVLVAITSAVVALGVLSGLSGVKGDVRADTKWPSVAVTTVAAETAEEGSGS
jgi:hypothetical protein